MEKPNFKYPKQEHLKSRFAIEALFTSGKTVSKYPLRLVFIPYKNVHDLPLQMGVSVSKRYFKRAVDRNRYKRLLRETYRLHKHLIDDVLEEPYAMMFLYQSKERLTYSEIEAKTIELFHKFQLFIEKEKENTAV